MQYLIDNNIKVDAVICDPPYGVFGDDNKGVLVEGFENQPRKNDKFKIKQKGNFGVDKVRSFNKGLNRELAKRLYDTNLSDTQKEKYLKLGTEGVARKNDLSWDVIIPLDEMWQKINGIINRQNANVILFGDEKFSYETRKSNEQGFRYNIIWDKIDGGIGIYAKHQPIKQFEYISIYGGLNNYSGFIVDYQIKLIKATNKNKDELCELLSMSSFSIGRFSFDGKGGSGLMKIVKKEKYDIICDLVKKNNLDYKLLTHDEYLSHWTPPVYNPQMIKMDKETKKGRHSKAIKNTWKIDQDKLKNTGNYTHKYPTNIWQFKKVTSSALHPTQKPIPLMEQLIKTYTNEGDLILDFTSGSGSTLLACKNTDRKCIGIELQKKYCDITIDRLENNIKPKVSHKTIADPRQITLDDLL